MFVALNLLLGERQLLRATIVIKDALVTRHNLVVVVSNVAFSVQVLLLALSAGRIKPSTLLLVHLVLPLDVVLDLGLLR